MLLGVVSCLTFKIVYFFICWGVSWLGVQLRQLFIVQGEAEHVGGLLGVKSWATSLSVNKDGWNALLKGANIPLRVKNGGIDRIEFKFGWFLLGRLSLRVHGLYLLFQTTDERYYNRDWQLQKTLQIKRLLVKKFEQLEGKARPTDSEKVGLFTKWIVRLLINAIRKIEISFEDVHIRGEDELSLVNETTSAGFALRSLVVREDILLNKRQSNGLGSAKTLDIHNMCLYWNPNEHNSLSSLSQDHAMDKLRLNPSTQTLGCCYVLKPFSVAATAVMSRGKFAILQWKVFVDLKGVDCELSKEQMRVVSQCLGYFKHLQNTLVFLEHRPKVPVFGHAKLWWLYAKKCIRLYFKRSKWDWFDLKEQRELRKNYAIYYEESLRKGTSRQLKRKLQWLEDEMSLLNILLVRKKVEEEVESALVSEATKIRQSRYSWLRPRNRWRNRPNWRDGDNSLTFYSLSGQCSVTDILFTLTDDEQGTEQKIELFTLQICNSHLSIIKEDHAFNFEVTLGNVQCVGMTNPETQARPNLLLWTDDVNESQPVLSVIMESTSNQSVVNKMAQFNHKIRCLLKSSVVIIDWCTVQYVSQFVALLTSVHKDLKDAVKERVKEVGRESQLKLRYFIANKELASVTANLHLPLVILPDTLGNEQHMVLQFGHLSVTTTENSNTSSEGVCQIFQSDLKGTRIMFQEEAASLKEWLSYLNDSTKNVLKDDNVISKLDNLNVHVTYNTYYNTVTPSKLAVKLHTSELHVSVSDEQLECVLEFCYGQISSLWTAIGTATNTVTSMEADDEVDASFILMDQSEMLHFEPLVSTVYRDLRRFSMAQPPLLARSVTELGLQGERRGVEEDDFTVFTCEANIGKVAVHVKRCKDKWIKGFLVLEIQEMGVVQELREQASRLVLKVSQVALKNMSRLDEDGRPVKLFVTEKDFLQLKYTFANPKTPLFSSAYEAIEEEYKLVVRPFTLCLHRETVCDIMSSVLNLNIPPFKSLFGVKDTGEARRGSSLNILLPAPPLAPPTSGAIRLMYCFNLCEFTVTMATEKANTILKANIIDFSLSYMNKYDNGEFNARIQRVSVLDRLITASPYNLVLSNLPDKQLLNVEVCWKTDEGNVNFISGDVSIGSIQAVYLHKLETTIQLFLMELYHYWNEVVEQVDIKLTAAVRTMKKSKRFPKQPQRQQKPKALIWSYRVDIHLEKPSLLLPRDSYDPDALRISMGETNIVCMNRSRTNTRQLSTIVEEPDSYGLFSRQEPFGPVSEATVTATAEMITVDWMCAGQEKTVAKAIKMSLNYSHFQQLYHPSAPSPWKLTIPDIEMSFTPEGLATVPEIIRSNFSEPEPVGLPWLPPSTTKQLKNDHTFYEAHPFQRSSCFSIEEEDSTPLIELVANKWVWLLYTNQGQESVVMATVSFENAMASFGFRAQKSGGVWLRGCINEIIGVEGSCKNHYQGNWRILGRSKVSKVLHSSSPNYPLVDMMIIRDSNGEMAVTGKMSAVCLCLWPNFLNTFVNFMKQCKVQETKTAKRRRRYQRSRSTVVATVSTPVKRIIRRPTMDTSRVLRTQQLSSPVGKQPEPVLIPIPESQYESKAPPVRFNLRLILDECTVAVLEDPDPQEITTPGVFVEFLSYKTGSSHAAIFDYTVTPSQWGITLSPCQLRARLCLYGETENVIPLNQVIPPTSLEFNYVSSKSLERMILLIPRLVFHLTDEFRQVFEQFYKSVSKPTVTKRRSTTAVSPTDIWVKKDIDRAAILPEPPQTEEADNDEEEDEFNEDDVFDDERKSTGLTERHQEATIEVKEFLVNCDLMCGGDSSTVMCFHSSAFAEVRQWENDDVSFDLHLTMEAYIYNEGVASWEPLIEPLEDAKIEGYRPYKLQVKVYRVLDALNETSGDVPPLSSPAPSHSSPSVSSKRDKQSRSSSRNVSQQSLKSSVQRQSLEPKLAYVIICTSDDHLEVTLTPSAIRTIKQYIEAQTKEHHIAMGNIRSAVQDSRPPVRVDNKTGVEVFVYPGPTFRDGSSSQEKYKGSVRLPTHAMRHFPSIVEVPEDVDFGRPLTQYHYPPRHQQQQRQGQTLSRMTSGSSIFDGIPLYLERHTISLATADDEDFDVESSISSEASISTWSGSGSITSITEDLPVIEGSMQDITDSDRTESRDETDSGLDAGSDSSVSRSRRRSVSRMRSLATSKNTERTHSSSKLPSYWRPKALFKAHKIKIQVDDSNQSKPIKISHPGVFAVPIQHAEYGRISVICEVSIKNSVRKVIIHSGLQIKNTLPVNVTIFTRKNSNATAEWIGEIERDQTYYVPLKVLGKQKLLTFGVGVGSDGIACSESFDWKKMKENKPVTLLCPESTQDGDGFLIQAVIYPLPALNVTSESPSHMIQLEPPLVLHNRFPISITVTLQTTPTRSTQPTDPIALEPNDDEQIVRFHWKGDVVIKIQFDYNNLTWHGHSTVKLGIPITSSVSMEGFDQTGKSVGKMFVCLQTDSSQVSRLNFFSPFWIVNKSGLSLEYEHQSGKGKSYKHVAPEDSSQPVLLTYNRTNKTHEHQKVKLRVDNGEWSKPFVIGVVGKSYSASSKKNDFLYEFSVETRLLKNTLTEIVYIMPKYSVLNETNVPLVCVALGPNGEGRSKTAIKLQPKQLLPFWPGSLDRVSVSVDELSSHARQFSLSVVSPMVLPMNNEKLPVLTVKIQHDPVKCAAVISLHSYADTGALLQVENLCRKLSVKFVQGMNSGSGQLYALSPDESILYTWDSPAGKRELKWQVIGAQEITWYPLLFEQVKQAGSVTLRVIKEDEKKREFNTVEVVTCYWATMFEGSQVVLRFFDNRQDYDRLMELRQQKESADLQFFCSLEGVGLSLVNNTPKEAAYCTISSSPTVWMRRQSKNGGAWSLINKENSAVLETAWRTRESSVTIANEEYDMDNMVIKGGKGGQLSRWFNPGIWVWYSQCTKRYSVSVKLGYVQIDNQLDDIELASRVVFSAQEATAEDVTAPFLDFLLTSTQDVNAIREIEKCFLKIKPAQANIEMGLIAALLPFTDVMADENIEIVEFSKDEMSLICKPLEELLKTDSLVQVRAVNHIDVLQVAQTSLSINYTTAGEYDLSSQWGKVLDAIIHFALITKGTFDINLKSVTIRNEVLDAEQIKRLIWGHYKNEMLLQFQRLALGLDVIGNPHKLLSSFQVGTKDLVNYSRQGIVEGDAGAGVAAGVKSFLGHFIEGSAESGVRSTGALSSMLLAATDIEYQQKHRYMRQARNEKNLSSNLKLGSTFFIKGVLHGTTDIIVKPITGASHKGFEGFMKGLGRGTLSVLVKPTLGAVDLAKYTMEGIRSTVDDDLDVESSRLPRLIHSNKVITPYNIHEAEGLYIIHHLSDPLLNENYVFHEWLPPVKPTADPLVVFVTSKQLMQLRKSRKHYRQEWSTGLENIVRTEAMQYVIEDQEEEETGLLLVYKDDSIFRKKQNTVLLKLEDTVGAQVLEERIGAARKSLIKHGSHV